MECPYCEENHLIVSGDQYKCLACGHQYLICSGCSVAIDPDYAGPGEYFSDNPEYSITDMGQPLCRKCYDACRKV